MTIGILFLIVSVLFIAYQSGRFDAMLKNASYRDYYACMEHALDRGIEFEHCRTIPFPFST